MLLKHRCLKTTVIGGGCATIAVTSAMRLTQLFRSIAAAILTLLRYVGGEGQPRWRSFRILLVYWTGVIFNIFLWWILFQQIVIQLLCFSFYILFCLGDMILNIFRDTCCWQVLLVQIFMWHWFTACSTKSSYIIYTLSPPKFTWITEITIPAYCKPLLSCAILAVILFHFLWYLSTCMQ